MSLRSSREQLSRIVKAAHASMAVTHYNRTHRTCILRSGADDEIRDADSLQPVKAECNPAATVKAETKSMHCIVMNKIRALVCLPVHLSPRANLSVFTQHQVQQVRNLHKLPPQSIPLGLNVDCLPYTFPTLCKTAKAHYAPYRPPAIPSN